MDLALHWLRECMSICRDACVDWACHSCLYILMDLWCSHAGKRNR